MKTLLAYAVLAIVLITMLSRVRECTNVNAAYVCRAESPLGDDAPPD